MRVKSSQLFVVSTILVVAVTVVAASAGRHVEIVGGLPNDSSSHGNDPAPDFMAKLRSSAEVPAYLGTGNGRFMARLDGDTLPYMLAYSLEGDVLQAHIHIGQPFANGGVVAFLCSSLDSAPAGVQPCDGTTEGMVAGTLSANDVVPTQGAETFGDLVEALASGLAYINVHSTASPSGEIRGQVRDLRYHDRGDGDGDDDDDDDHHGDHHDDRGDHGDHGDDDDDDDDDWN